MIHTREVIKGPWSLGEPKHILMELNKIIEDQAVIAGGHVVLLEETGMRINFVPVKAPDVICNFDHTPATEMAMVDGNGACKSSDTPKESISEEHSWSGYCGDLASWVLLILGVKRLDLRVSNKLLVVALICPLIMGCSATNDCAEVAVEFELCREYCNTFNVSPTLDRCAKLSAAASINEKNRPAQCTCYLAKSDTYTEIKCHTAKLVLLCEFCRIPVNQFPYRCKNVVLPPPTTTTTEKSSPKKPSLLGFFKVGVYIVGSLLTLSAGGLAIWLKISYLVLNRPGDEEAGTKLADLAVATSNISSGLAPA